jgi:single-stranded DNA-binding protein
MLTKKNLVVLEGGLTRDPEIYAEAGVVHFSLGVDSSGSEKGVQNPSGYFDLKVWTTPSKYTPAATAEDVKKYLEEGILVKGARVSVVGRLVQERWLDKEGKKNARTVIMVETIDLFRAKGTMAGQAPAGSVAQASETSAPPSIDEF